VDNKIVRVLLVGRSERTFAHVSRYLDKSGCECKFASSYTDGLKLLAETRFDLVLCSGQPGIKTLASSVVGSSASVFCAHAVEDGCWWLPVVRHGEECLGAPALRPGEFRILLEETLAAMKSSQNPRAAAAAS
jgi:hypothetical protein